MRVDIFGTPIFIYSLPNAKEFNNFILDKYKYDPSFRINYEDQEKDPEIKRNLSILNQEIRQPIDTDDVFPNLEPAITALCNENSLEMNIKPQYPWINFMQKGDHQEIHTHPDSNIVCVYMVKLPKDGAKLFLYQQQTLSMAYGWWHVSGENQPKSFYVPDLKEGDCIFFPGYMEHAVSKHKVNEERVTISQNINLVAGDDGTLRGGIASIGSGPGDRIKPQFY